MKGPGDPLGDRPLFSSRILSGVAALGTETYDALIELGLSYRLVSRSTLPAFPITWNFMHNNAEMLFYICIIIKA
jgi:hypothetical protein